MVIVCDSCGRENEDEFKFCLGCGSELSAEESEPEQEGPQMVECPSCNSEVPGGFKFCGQCGGSLVDAPSASKSESETEDDPDTEPSITAGAQQAGAERLGELTVIRPDGTEGANIPLTSAGVIIGRDSEFDVLADDSFLSPRHAEIRYDDGRLTIRDLESLNGVFWRLRDDVKLQHGDLVRIGQELLEYQEFAKVNPVEPTPDRPDLHAHGSPDPGVWARLSLVGGPKVETKAFPIMGDGATIGREVGSVLFREDGFVSGKHAKIYREDGEVYLRDLGSSNGSYIRIRKQREISHGDLVLVGQQLLRVTLD